MATAVVEERELLKTISWFDGFVVALANPSFLITGLGGSALSLGGWGAVILWTVSVIFGALHNYIYSETATMFPKLSGGIAIYAHEAWKRYFSFVGPVAAFGYWIGWSVVLSATGVVVGFLVQAQFYTSSATSAFWTADPRHFLGIPFYWSFPIALTSVIIIVIWAFNVSGMRPAVWVGYVTGVLLLIPLAVLMFLPYITGDWSSSNMQWDIGANGGLPLVIVWLYFMCWSSYGMEWLALRRGECNASIQLGNENQGPRLRLAHFAAFAIGFHPLQRFWWECRLHLGAPRLLHLPTVLRIQSNVHVPLLEHLAPLGFVRVSDLVLGLLAPDFHDLLRHGLRDAIELFRYLFRKLQRTA